FRSCSTGPRTSPGWRRVFLIPLCRMGVDDGTDEARAHWFASARSPYPAAPRGQGRPRPAQLPADAEAAQYARTAAVSDDHGTGAGDGGEERILRSPDVDGGTAHGRSAGLRSDGRRH